MDAWWMWARNRLLFAVLCPWAVVNFYASPYPNPHWLAQVRVPYFGVVALIDFQQTLHFHW